MSRDWSVAVRRCTIAVALVTAACGGGGSDSATGPTGGGTTTGTSNGPSAITAVGGSGQVGSAGAALGSPLVVKVTNASGAAVSGATVAFAVTSGTATLSPTTAVTDATGQASTQVTLGGTTGAVQISATVQGTTISTSFTATVGTITSANCAAGSGISLAVGQVSAASGTSICVTGATGAEYALVPFNGSTTYRNRVGFTVQATGVDPVSTTLTNVIPRRATTAATTSASPTADGIDGDYGALVRARARRTLEPLVPAARSWYAQRNAPSSVRRTAIPSSVTVGQLVSLNANSDDACANPDNRAARVQAIGTKAIVVADTLNPTGGYTQADYQSIAATFDTLVDAVDRKNFGDPSDIDGNTHVVLFFTSAVNALTPRNSSSFVGGFFDSRDLFPTRQTTTLPGCLSSNVGELFYLLVPDPGGTINGNRFSKTFVTTLTIATVAHEYQHLINASRRLYVNLAADDFEETWLDEGLAHVAEELVFYARSGMAPRQNIDATALRASTTRLTAFADDAISNFDRLSLYLESPPRHSPYADDDSLETRGATWSFLRYAVDQRASSAQEALWFKLANSTTTGIANLQQALGTDVTTLFHDWSLSLIADDLAGADARYQFPSWNLRSVFSMPNVYGSYPLQTVALTSGASSTASIAGGSAAYFRFAVGSGKTASLAWNALPSSMQVSVVRLR